MRSVYCGRILLELVPCAGLSSTKGYGVRGKVLRKRAPGTVVWAEQAGLLQAHPSSLVPERAVRPGAASAFVAVEIALRSGLSSSPGSGPRSRLPTPQCRNAICYFLLEQIKSGTMTHSG